MPTVRATVAPMNFQSTTIIAQQEEYLRLKVRKGLVQKGDFRKQGAGKG
jgi:hypothetical protein